MSAERGHFHNKWTRDDRGESKEDRRRREQMHRRARHLYSRSGSSRTGYSDRLDPQSNSIRRRRAHPRTRMRDNWRNINENCMKLIEDCQEIIERLQSKDNILGSGAGGVNHSNLVQLSSSSETNPQSSFDDMLENLRTSEHYQPPHLTCQRIERLMSSSSSASSSLCPLQFIEVSLVCPLSKTKMKLPIRSKRCKHLGCCDATTFLSLVGGKPDARWKCPICLLPMPYKDIKVDGFLTNIIEEVKDEALKIEFTSSTTWRVKEETGVPSANQIPNTSKTKEIPVIDLTSSPLPKAIEKDSKYHIIDLTDSP